jgi:subtilase family serine protease
MPFKNLRRLPFVALLIVMAALLGVGVVAASSRAAADATAVAGPPVPLAASAAPRVPAGAALLGAVPASTTMTVTVTLNLPDQAALTAFLNGLADPSSPYYQHFLNPGQFGPMFGPSLSQVAGVESALRAAGLSPGPVAADRLSIPVTATAAAIERAFGVTLARYRLAGGRLGFANTTAPKVPAAVASLVQGILGLDDLYPEQAEGDPAASASDTATKSAASRAAVVKAVAGPKATIGTARPAVNPGPQPCAAIQGDVSGLTAADIAAHYGLAQRYGEGDYGQGVRIGVLELEPNLTSDITAYKQCYGISTKVNYLKIDGGVGTGAGSGEAALDIETLAGLAPRATIDVYQAPNGGNGLYDIFKKWVTSDTDKIMSVSWGSCEAVRSAAYLNAQEALFEQANAQDQTIFSAAGDNGSTGCSSNATPNARLSAVTPASDPYVISVGGTSFGFTSNNDLVEITWNDSGIDSGAGGGGVSTHWCMPAYQHRTAIPNIVNRDSVKDTNKKACASGYYREVPDISALGDPFYGYAIFAGGQWIQVGGTSAATPVWASIAALTEDSGFCSGYRSKGAFLPQTLYAVAANYHSYIYASSPQGLDDVTYGNNDYTPSGYSGGKYPATRGYDMATGLGSPMVSGLSGLYGGGKGLWYTFLAGLSQLMCHQSATTAKTVKVTSVSPARGTAGKSRQVVVHGSGFLSLAGADEAQIIWGRKVLATVAASCSATKCTLTVPAESARTIDIKIFAVSLWSSPLTAKDRYRYVK